MLEDMVGKFSLNFSMLLYLIGYLPQLFHNHKKKQLANLSLHFHNFLIISYITDLMYGFGLSMPWQYRLVSITGTICLLIQHKQLWELHSKNPYFIFSTYSLFLLAIFNFITFFYNAPVGFFICIGYIAQITGLLHVFPQIYKNIGSESAVSLHIGYLTLTFLCALCDNVSAWILHWPTPSKVGAIISITAYIVLLTQWVLSHRKLSVKVKPNHFKSTYFLAR